MEPTSRRCPIRTLAGSLGITWLRRWFRERPVRQAGGGGEAAGRGGAAAGTQDPAAALTAAGVDPAALAAAGVDIASLAGTDVSALAEQAVAFGVGRGGGAKDGGGLTSLVLASRQDCLECAKILLESGADVNQVTNYGW